MADVEMVMRQSSVIEDVLQGRPLPSELLQGQVSISELSKIWRTKKLSETDPGSFKKSILEVDMLSKLAEYVRSTNQQAFEPWRIAGLKVDSDFDCVVAKLEVFKQLLDTSTQCTKGFMGSQCDAFKSALAATQALPSDFSPLKEIAKLVGDATNRAKNYGLLVELAEEKNGKLFQDKAGDLLEKLFQNELQTIAAMIV